MSTTKSVEFRSLPTPEQIRAHGDGGLWGAPEPKKQYRFWDRQRGSAPWFDSTPFINKPYYHNIPYWNQFRPLNPDGTPRDWAEIDAIVAAAKASVAESEYRAPTDVELRAHNGLWLLPNGHMYDIWAEPESGNLRGYFHINVPMRGRGDSWAVKDHGIFANERKHLRPVDKQGKPIAWESLASKLAQQEADAEWRPLPDTETLKRHPWWVANASGDYSYMCTSSDGLYDIGGHIRDLTEMKPRLSIDTHRSNTGYLLCLYKQWRPCDSAGTPIVWSAIAQPQLVQAAQAPAQQLTREMEPGMVTIQRVSESALDCFAAAWYNITRKPNETDEQLRQRCRDLWTAKDKPMAQNYTPLSAALPDFAKMSPEDRARYRAALDAVDPPTTRDAIRSGLEHAPVEIALDKLHNFVAKLANLWTEGSDEDRQTAARFLRDMVGSDYGKAAIGLAAGAALPHAAPLANKLLPDDKDAAPLLRRVGFILAERGTATGAKRLGLDIWDTAGPMLDELRSMLRDLVKGMKHAETVAGFLPPASPKLDLAAGVVEAETVTQKR